MTWHDFDVRKASALVAFQETLKAQKKRLLKLTNREALDDNEQERYDSNWELGSHMISDYADWSVQIDDFVPILVEIEFEVPIPGFEDVVYQGRCDLIVRDKNGRYWIVDHKTAGQFGSTEWLDMDEQCGSYIWALQRQLEIPIQGVIYNQLLKDYAKPPDELKRGGYSKNKQQRTTFDLYKKTLIDNNEDLDDYWEFLDFLKDKGNPFFRRLQVTRSPREIELLGERIAIEASDMLNDPAIYPSPGMFNCMGCGYRMPCLATLDGTDTKYILNEQFVKRG
jgi:hypothetical protein